MGYPAQVTGKITITPPLEHAEMTAQHHPLTADPEPWPASQRQAWVHTTDSTVETGQGTLIKREGDYIRAYSGAESPHRLEEDIAEIVAAWPDHQYDGYLELVFTDEGQRERIVVRDGKVVTITPKLVWPGGVTDEMVQAALDRWQQDARTGRETSEQYMRAALEAALKAAPGE
jgi:hypothetical protein